MATYIESLKKPNGDYVMPRTKSKAVSMEDGTTVEAAIALKAPLTHTHDISEVTGLTATPAELDYMSGVTKPVQTQINGLQTALGDKSDSGHTHSDATTSAAGFMTAAMVTKLNGIATGATKITVDSALSSSSTNPVQNKVVQTALAGKAPAYTYSTTDLTAGSSSLTTGTLYFYYE